MDKGVKGLLVGDLSPALLLEIQRSIGKYEKRCETFSRQITELLDKQQTLDTFMSKYFTIDSLEGPGSVYDRNLPKYGLIGRNFQDFVVTLKKRTWQNELKLKESDYANLDLSDNRTIVPANFQDAQNMQTFVESKAAEVRNEHEEKIQTLKKEFNTIINQLYDEITDAAMNMDRFRVPLHGIQNPDLENPVNLF